MIECVFRLANQKIVITIDGDKIYFFDLNNSTNRVPIDYLRISKDGVCREFPEFKDKENWRELAISRFKYHINLLGSEDKRADYVVDELRKMGYTPELKQKHGFRAVKL